MKSQVLTLLLLTIGAHLFQSTHQYRLQKREINEYHLTEFIVTSCSADKVDVFIQNLCDQTLQSALMGHFPFLTYYCNEFGSGNRYCNNINRYTIAAQDAGTKRFLSRRFIRSLNEQEINTKVDLEQKLILKICMKKVDKHSTEIDRFCNLTLQQIQQGRYPEIKSLCKFHPGFNYCRDVLSSSSLYSLPSSLLSSSSSTITPDSHRTSVPLEFSKLSDVESVIDQQRMNKNMNKSPLS
ncbi:unnamed protein product [Adineta steineri]|uniref:Uncharacterized protein n=1 Tax=Adineta steineri TaxID=433720 RepID=A0A815PCP2_9BILA|nr:unnamed protein product [Adineta steineri]